MGQLTCVRFLLPLFLPFLLATAAASAGAADRFQAIFHDSYGDARSLVIHGRVLEFRKSAALSVDDNALRNLKNSAKTLRNSAAESREIKVGASGGSWTVNTDHEGYFSLEAATPAELAPGWHQLDVAGIATLPPAQLLIVPAENKLGIISDIDDTVVESNVLNKRKLISNTYLKNPAQRKAVAGVADFYRSVAQKNPRPELAPIFYLSASPSQLHSRIQAFLDLNRFPHGVLVTKKINKKSEADPWLDQVKFKTAHIESLLQRLPEVRFVLVGDDGEKDPETYHGIHTRFPERIDSVYIRRVNPDPARVRYPEQKDLTQAL